MTSDTTIQVLGSAKYLSLTTFRKDGSPVATPVWLVRDGDALRIVTGPESGKVKRLRNNPRVRVAPCDMRGRVKDGVVAVEATARFQDEWETAATMALIRKRYGLMGRILGAMNERRAKKAGSTGHAGITITIGAVAADA